MDTRTGMVRILEAVVDATAQGPADMTAHVRSAVKDMPAGEFEELVGMLKASRCLQVVTEETEDGRRVISSIDGITTRGLRELQKAHEPPTTIHACPIPGEEGRLGFSGR